MKSFIIILHFIIIIFSFGSFLLALRIWKGYRKKTGSHISDAWKIFTVGLLLLGISETIDVFTPIYEQVIATLNVYSEATETVALAMLILGITIFIRKWFKEQAPFKRSPDEDLDLKY